jgi:hypothetical protein
MLMRYHWGISIGHLYVQDRAASTTKDTLDLELSECMAIEQPLVHEERNAAEIDREIGLDADQEELELRNREDDKWEDVEVFGDEDEQAEESDDDVTMAMDEMYGSRC